MNQAAYLSALYQKKMWPVWGILITFILWSVFASSCLAETRPDVATRVIAYQGNQGVKVWTLRIGERKAHEALVKIEDVDHDWNLLILKMKITRLNDELHYSYTQGKKRHTVLVLKQNGGLLYLPGEPIAINLSYSDSLSDDIDAQRFLTEYLSQ
ncbi:hypothetical protein [Rosenbergiella australiborealis]|uniref:Uncharacterized protein n=1 Tax=Rosenbergiella australiborealis TaxID=1544696 RepID=A0ABS5T498_9GAMM|nr:hypothetical protein [Rosenbergiella australiborealis]MBT0727184.1 hypothetical protein [Rosenbergiella australiborealis]